MKVFILADPNSIHTRRWVTSLSKNGIEIFVFGVNKHDSSFYRDLKNVTLYSEDLSARYNTTSTGKIRYLSVLKTLKLKLKEFKPDLLHSHYASSYGFLGALTDFHPYLISVWGSDIYTFPRISFFHRSILRYSLSKSDLLLSTSKILASETRKYTKKKIVITPFGVDCKAFSRKENNVNDQKIRIGTVKSLDLVYGIDTLIKSFKLLISQNRDKDLILEIVGDGPDKEMLTALAHDLGIEKEVVFSGRKDNSSLPSVYNQFTIFAALSNSESFGVVALEAMACECPVVLSDADGFSEIVTDMVNGLIVPRKDPDSAAKAIQKLIEDPQLRIRLGSKGREEVLEKYDWEKNVELMIGIYKSVSLSK